MRKEAVTTHERAPLPLGSVGTYATLGSGVAVGAGVGDAVAGASFTRGPIRFA